jgi:hypothetical protein
MHDNLFKNVALSHAAIVALLAPFVSESNKLVIGVATKLSWSGSVIAVLLFARILLNPHSRGGFDQLNTEMRADAIKQSSRRRLLGIGLLNEKWGLFGSRVGSPAILIVRTVLLAEFVIFQFVFGGNMQPTLMAGASAFIAMELSIIYAVEQTLPKDHSH